MMIALSLTAVVYIGFVALVQSDMKKLIAYSSISHMGFVTLGFFIFNSARRRGRPGADDFARLHFGGHVPLRRGPLRPHALADMIADYGGVVQHHAEIRRAVHVLCHGQCWLTSDLRGFVGEFMVILGADASSNFWVGFAAATTLILGAAYTLWMIQACGVRTRPANHARRRTRRHRWRGSSPYCSACWRCACCCMGLYPFPFTEVMHASVENLLKHVARAQVLKGATKQRCIRIS
jgi:NADH-quinone oxidoreductase subunit M